MDGISFVIISTCWIYFNFLKGRLCNYWNVGHSCVSKNILRIGSCQQWHDPVNGIFPHPFKVKLFFPFDLSFLIVDASVMLSVGCAIFSVVPSSQSFSQCMHSSSIFYS